jgi:hypothetical protein
MRDDDLEAARGVVYLCLASFVLWALIALCYWIAR